MPKITITNYGWDVKVTIDDVDISEYVKDFSIDCNHVSDKIVVVIEKEQKEQVENA